MTSLHREGDVVKCVMGGVGIISEVLPPSNGMPHRYSVNPIEGYEKPPYHAWFYDEDFSAVIGPSALRLLKK